MSFQKFDNFFSFLLSFLLHLIIFLIESQDYWSFSFLWYLGLLKFETLIFFMSKPGFNYGFAKGFTLTSSFMICSWSWRPIADEAMSAQEVWTFSVPFHPAMLSWMINLVMIGPRGLWWEFFLTIMASQ